MLFWIVFVVAVAFGLGAILGAPYLPVLSAEHDALLDLSGLAAGQTLIDLGSGDGRLLRAAARRGIRCIGYEINPFLYLASLIYTWPDRHLVTVHLGDYWAARLPAADAIYVFLIERYMTKLDRKLQAELTKPTTVVSYIFSIPGRSPELTTRNAFKYRYAAK